MPYDLCNTMYSTTMYMDFYFNINMDSTYAKKYYTLVCFHPYCSYSIWSYVNCDCNDPNFPSTTVPNFTSNDEKVQLESLYFKNLLMCSSYPLLPIPLLTWMQSGRAGCFHSLLMFMVSKPKSRRLGPRFSNTLWFILHSCAMIIIFENNFV